MSNELFRGLSVMVHGPTEDVEVTFPDVGLRAPTQLLTAEFETSAGDGPNDYRLFVWLTDEVSPDEIRARYAEEVAHVDRYVGGLMDELRARDLFDDTLVVFTSDHGESLMLEGERGHIGHVRYLYDPLIRVPLVIKPPRGGQRSPRSSRRGATPPSRSSTWARPSCPCAACRSCPDNAASRSRRAAAAHRSSTSRRRTSPRHRRIGSPFATSATRWSTCRTDDAFAMYDMQADPLETEDRFAELSGERPDWVDRLRTIAETSAASRREGGPGSEAARMLEALGYGGGG